MVAYHNKTTKIIKQGQPRISDYVREYLDNLALLQSYVDMTNEFSQRGMIRATNDYVQLAIEQYNLCLTQQYELLLVHGVNV